MFYSRVSATKLETFFFVSDPMKVAAMSFNFCRNLWQYVAVMLFQTKYPVSNTGNTIYIKKWEALDNQETL